MEERRGGIPGKRGVCGRVGNGMPGHDFGRSGPWVKHEITKTENKFTALEARRRPPEGLFFLCSRHRDLTFAVQSCLRKAKCLLKRP